jgi:hypothetical protein
MTYQYIEFKVTLGNISNPLIFKIHSWSSRGHRKLFHAEVIAETPWCLHKPGELRRKPILGRRPTLGEFTFCYWLVISRLFDCFAPVYFEMILKMHCSNLRSLGDITLFHSERIYSFLLKIQRLLILPLRTSVKNSYPRIKRLLDYSGKWTGIPETYYRRVWFLGSCYLELGVYIYCKV